MQIISKIAEKDLKDKKVLLRVDFNVPVEGGKIQEKYRILAHRETIDFLLRGGAKVLLVSHHSKDGFSFEKIVGQISKIVGHDLTFAKDPKSVISMSKGSARLYLLDNIRLFSGEEKNDKEFARLLAGGFDFYVNDAFSVAHRNHASVSAITEFLPSYAGFLIEKETNQLSGIIQKPANSKTLIIGGGKVKTKVPLVKNFLDKAGHILIGGAVANSFFKIQGFEVGLSVVDGDTINSLKSLIGHPAIILPEDVIISQSRDGKSKINPFPAGNIDPFHYILDIGPESAKHFSNIIKNSKLVIWNGPMGQFEVDAFSQGTIEIVKAMEQTSAYTIIGGGDTISAFDEFGSLEKVDFVSTGGGAMLEFLAEKELPGLKALGYYG